MKNTPYSDFNLTYSELLEDERWANIRNKILMRDSLECLNCSNERIMKTSVLGEIISIERIQLLLEVLNTNDPRIKKLYRVKFLDVFKQYQEIEIKAFYEYSEDELEHLKGEQVFYSKAKNLSFLNTEAEYPVITCIPDPTKRFKWFYVDQLHVHHTYYERGKQPWEYPLNSLQTLCWLCHSNEHDDRY